MNQNQIERLISDKFSVSLMNDSKWDKLIQKLTDTIKNGVFLNYKLVHNEKIYDTSFDTPDFKPFFIEPIFYKEVEWIQFPKEYLDYVSESNHKAGKKLYKQDIDFIEKIIIELGQFEFEKSSNYLKLYGYK